MVRRIFARAAVVALLGLTVVVGLVVNAGTSQALDLPNWLTSGTACSKDSYSNPFKNAGPTALAAAGSVALTTDGAVAAGAATAGAATVDLTAPLVIGALMQGCVLPGLARNVVAPWLFDKFGGGQNTVTSPDRCPDGCNVYFFGRIAWAVTPSYGDTQVAINFDPMGTAGRDAVVGFDGYCVDNTVQSSNMVIPALADMGGETHAIITTPTCTSGHGGVKKVVLTPSGKACGVCTPSVSAYTNILTWEGTPAVPPTSVTATTSCVRPDGSTYDLASTTAPTIDSQGDGYTVPLCNAGDTPTRVRSGTGTSTLWDANLKPRPEDLRRFPQCAAAACSYAVAIDGQTCIQGDPECANWELVRRNSPSRVECLYGPYTVDCGLLNWMERAYESGNRRATKLDIDGNPDTKSTTTTDVLVNPTGTPSTPPVVPSRPPVIDKCLAGDVACVPQVDPNNSTDNCWPTGWGAINPANWVLQPIKCALKWAFVPRGTVVQGLTTQITTDITTSGPGPLVVPFTSAWASVAGAGGSGCAGPELDFNYNVMHVQSHPLDACSGWKATAAGLTKLFLSVTVVIGGGVYVINSIASAFGYSKPFARTAGGDA